MPSCLAFGCSNTSGRLQDKKNFFKIPDPKKNAVLCSRWLHNMGNSKWNVKNFEASNNRCVCSDHFHSDSFARDLVVELLPEPGNRKTKLKLGEY